MCATRSRPVKRILPNANPLNYREDLVRVDYRINDQHTLYGRRVDDFNTVYLAYGPGCSVLPRSSATSLLFAPFASGGSPPMPA